MAINPQTGLEEEIDPVTGQPVNSTTMDLPKIDINAYIKQKYGISDKYDDAAREKLVNEIKPDWSDRLVAGLGALGAGIAGGNALAGGQAILSQQKAGREEKLNQFDTGRKNELEKFGLSREFEKAGREDKLFSDAERIKEESRDPNSERSKNAQAGLIELGMDPKIAAGLSAEQAEARIPTLKAKLDRMDKQREFSLKEQEMGIKRSTAGGEKAAFGRLPVDQQETIKALSKDNAGKVSITNSIDSVIDKWDDFTDEQKLQQGRQLIKTLNSTQGKDAVGAEESKRLASKLEFAMGNLSNDNPIQFGRDLEGFKEDAKITSQAIKDAMEANKQVIDQSYGRQSQQAKPVQGKIKVSDGKQTLYIDSSDLADAEADGFKRI